MATLEQAYAGRTAFITGAASGIGLELTRQLMSQGCNVMMSDRDGNALKAAYESLPDSNANVAHTVVDVVEADDLARAATETVERFGAVHHVFNNAGVGVGGEPGSIDLRDWRWIVDINLMGVVYGVEAFVPHVASNDIGADGLRGHIVNTASMAGHMTLPGMAPYHATKYAVVGYSEALRQELARAKVGVTALCPTFVKTNIHKSGINSPTAAGRLNEDDPTYALAAEMVANGMELDLFVTLALRAVAENRCHSFNDPMMSAAFDLRREQLQADLKAGLADLEGLSGS